MAKDAAVPIRHMLDAIAGLRDTAGGRDAAALASDWMRMRAIERGFEIISEASRRIPEEIRATETDIPWAKIAGLGNVLRHDYHQVEASTLLFALSDEIPPLEVALRRMLGRL